MEFSGFNRKTGGVSPVYDSGGSVADAAAGVEGPVRIFRPAEYGNSHPEPALYVGCFQDTEGDAFEQHEQVVDTFCE